MSRSNVDAPTEAALAAPHVTYLLFIELDLDTGPQRLVSAPHDVQWDGHTWTAAQGIGTVEPVVETDSEARGLVFTLSHVPSANLAAALNPGLQGRAVTLHVGVVDDTGVLRVERAAWQGELDAPTIEDGAPTGVIRFTAEHAGIAWRQSSGLLMSDEDQQQLHPGDKFFEYGAQMADAVIVWPGREFFKR